jgi:hypothetical protein
MVFLETDVPPFYDLTCPKHDTITGETKTRKKKKKKKKAKAVEKQMAPAASLEPELPEEEEYEHIQKGYAGKPKGEPIFFCRVSRE